MNRIAVCLLVVLTALGATHASGAEYPAKSIRLVVPFAPGGGKCARIRVMGSELLYHLPPCATAVHA